VNELAPNPSFIPGTKLQFAWDSVSLGALMKCARFYQLSIVEGWEPRAKSADLQFGLWLHGARERFYHFRASGESFESAQALALLWLFEETFDRELSRPWFSDHPEKNRFTLIRTFVWYTEHWRNDPLETVILSNGKPAVELSFKFDTGYKYENADWSISSQPILYCGHIDRLVDFNDTRFVSDLKSTKSTLSPNYFSGFSPDAQLDGYAYAAKIVFGIETSGILLDAAQVVQTFSDFHRHPVPRDNAQLFEWHEDLGWWFSQAREHALASHWPMNKKACFLCHFRKVCAMTPGAREQWLKADFVKRQWNPLEARGDI